MSGWGGIWGGTQVNMFDQVCSSNMGKAPSSVNRHTRLKHCLPATSLPGGNKLIVLQTRFQFTYPAIDEAGYNENSNDGTGADYRYSERLLIVTIIFIFLAFAIGLFATRLLIVNITFSAGGFNVLVLVLKQIDSLA